MDGQYLIQRLELTTLIAFILTAVNVLAKRLIISLLVINWRVFNKIDYWNDSHDDTGGDQASCK